MTIRMAGFYSPEVVLPETHQLIAECKTSYPLRDYCLPFYPSSSPLQFNGYCNTALSEGLKLLSHARSCSVQTIDYRCDDGRWFQGSWGKVKTWGLVTLRLRFAVWGSLMSRNSYEKLTKAPSSAPNLKPELSSGTLVDSRRLWVDWKVPTPLAFEQWNRG
jgi:hypothetical protein